MKLMVNKQIIKKYLLIWLILARNSFLIWLSNKKAIIIFLLGKSVRYTFYFLFLYYLFEATGGFSGYSKDDALFIATTFVLVDTFSQLIFRGVYTFRQLVISGDFDLILVKPVNSLYRVLLGSPDFVDLLMLFPIVIANIYFAGQIGPGLVNIVFYFLALLFGLVISASIHIFLLAMAILIFEVDHMIMIYRDISSMARFPVDIYGQALQGLLTFVVPVGLMVFVPAKLLMGQMNYLIIILLMIYSFAATTLSLWFWKFALKKYTSASS